MCMEQMDFRSGVEAGGKPPPLHETEMGGGNRLYPVIGQAEWRIVLDCTYAPFCKKRRRT